jgi:hypothetical protein
MALADRPHKNIIRSVRFACWILKATDMHSECVTLTAFAQENGYTNAPQCYVVYTLPVLYIVRRVPKGFLICHLIALLGGATIVDVSRIREYDNQNGYLWCRHVNI